MRCLSCGTELDGDSRYCSKCGAERSVIINRIEKFPKELKDLVDLVIGNLAESVRTDHNATNSDLVIKCMDNVYNVPESMRGKIYAAGSVSFAPAEKFLIDFSYSGQPIQSALFSNTAVMRRESGDDKCIAIYTDQGTYRIRKEIMNEIYMRDISRDPIVIVKYEGEFYIFCPKKDQYLILEGKPIKPQLVQILSVNQTVQVNAHSSIMIRYA